MSHPVVYPLRSCVGEITLACCFSCRYCGSGAGKPRENELSTEECLDVANQLADLGCRRVSLIGGEVFLRCDWRQISKALTDRNVKVSIITNGYLFSKDLIDAIKSCKIESVAVSLDGPEPVHDKFRQRGSFRRALRAIDILTSNNIPVSVISTLHSENIAHLDELFEVLKTKAIFAWQLQACSPMGNASAEGFSPRIEFQKVLSFVETHLYNPYFAVGVADNIGYYTAREGYLRGNNTGNAPYLGCRAGLTMIGIDSIGNVRGCESMYEERLREGSLRETSLYEIWHNPEGFSYNRKFTSEQLTGKCKDCEDGGICAGGCRSYNYFTHQNMYESPFCVKGSGAP